MPMSDAQKRAQAEYRKKVKQLTVRFYPNSAEDEAMYEWLKSRPEGSGPYIKALVAVDMERKTHDGAK